MGVRENKVEKSLKDKVRALGGKSYKWISGEPGVTDQIVIVSGHFWLVEIKTVDGVLSPAQKRRHEELGALGARVRTVYGEMGVREFIEEVKHVIKTAAT